MQGQMDCFFTQNEISEGENAHIVPIYAYGPKQLDEAFGSLSEFQANIARTLGFKGDRGQVVKIPDETGNLACVLFGTGSNPDDELGATRTGKLAASLKKGRYKFAKAPDSWDRGLMAIGWGLGAYKFDAYLKSKSSPAQLDLTDYANASEIRSRRRCTWS